MIQEKIICALVALIMSFPGAMSASYEADKAKAGSATQIKAEIENAAPDEAALLSIKASAVENAPEPEAKEAPAAALAQPATAEKARAVNKKSLGTFKVTAYCPCEKCNGKWAGQTASGVKPTQGVTVAVDRKVIPLGTKLYIEGVGEVIAQDTGVSGHSVDVFMSSHNNALKWGVKKLNVWVLG